MKAKNHKCCKKSIDGATCALGSEFEETSTINRIPEVHDFFGKIWTTQGKICGPNNSLAREVGVSWEIARMSPTWVRNFFSFFFQYFFLIWWFFKLRHTLDKNIEKILARSSLHSTHYTMMVLPKPESRDPSFGYPDPSLVLIAIHHLHYAIVTYEFA